MRISARNQLPGTITDINHGAVTTTVKVALGGGDVITASITREAAEVVATCFRSLAPRLVLAATRRSVGHEAAPLLLRQRWWRRGRRRVSGP